MNNKKITTALTLLLLLGSGMAGAEWGDVYYCVTKTADKTDFYGVKTKIELGNGFKFKVDKTRNGMVVGHGEFMEVHQDLSLVGESWSAEGSIDFFHIDNGRFIYSINTLWGIEVSTGTCDKF